MAFVSCLGLCYCTGLGQSSFLCPSGQRSTVAIYACATPLHVVVVLLCVVVGASSVFGVFSAFSHPPAPLFHYNVFYYRLYYCLLLLLFH